MISGLAPGFHDIPPLTATGRGAQPTNGANLDAIMTPRAMGVVLAVRSTDYVANLAPPEYLVQDWIVDGCLLCLYGKPGTLKSLAAQSLAFCLASGRDWYGHHVTPSTVLYVAAEGSAGLGKRINAWCEDIGATTSDLDQLRWLPLALNLLDDELANGLVLAAKEHDAHVVIIDTVARSTPGINENDSAPFSKVVGVADRLRAEGRTVILIHHSPKHGEGMRGHTTLEGAVDTAIEARREPAQPYMTLSMTKQKDFAEPDDITFKLRQVAESVVLDRSESRGTVTGNGTKLLDALRDSNGTALTARELMDATGVSKTNTHKTLADLEKQGRIRNTNPAGAAQWIITETEPVP